MTNNPSESICNESMRSREIGLFMKSFIFFDFLAKLIKLLFCVEYKAFFVDYVMDESQNLAGGVASP